MNNTFDIRRFGLLLRKDILENWKKNLMMVLSLYGILVIIYSFMSYSAFESLDLAKHTEADWTRMSDYAARLNENLLVFSMFVFLGGGIILASMMMSPMATKIKRTAFLMSPESSFEKYLSRWIQAVIVYIAVFVAAMFLADATRVLVCTMLFPDAHIPFLDLSKLLKTSGAANSAYSIFHASEQLFFVICFYTVIQSLFVLGSTFWAKNSLIKTFSAGVIIAIAYVLIAKTLIDVLFERKMSGLFHMFSNTDDNGVTAMIVMSLFLAVMTLFNWILAYFRFKESEIIEKW